MKKPTFSRPFFISIMLIIGIQSFAQNYVPFSPRFNQDIKGDIALIGNNILGPDNNAFNDVTVFNHMVDMQFIDIDGDASTFSSSSADLNIPNPNCYEIKYAGLYWGAVNPGNTPITDVKFKGPNGNYIDVQGTIIYDANGSTVDGGDSFSYACFADVTSIVTSFGTGNDLGTYTVANVSTATGETALFTPFNGTGQSAGWSLFIVYEDATLPNKSITSFDGFSAISVAGGNPNLDIPVNGFRTVPAPSPVRASFAFATLEGDSPIIGDGLRLNGVSLSTTDRPVDNFFNSSVTQLSALPVTNRLPNSTNTLGFDTGVIAIPNPNNTVIANDATSGIITLETTGDTYFPYFFAFAVEIIEPNIVLTKIVEDDAGNNIGGQVVGLAQPLNYVIGFQNTGNDNATNFQIRDVLPINIEFNYPSDLVLPPGVTVSSYNPTTRELIFDIDSSLVEENDPVYEIRIEVQTVSSCRQLADACSNIINNQAFATYNGFFNPNFQITDDPSYGANTGCLLTPQATNFLADLDNCVFEEEVTLCGATVDLTAANGYSAYSWSTSPTGSPVIGTTQTITVSNTGTYYVTNTADAPCRSIDQVFNVVLFGDTTANPVIPFADEVVICPDNGKALPNIFLCGSDDFTLIETNISDSSSIIWEVLDETSCTAVTNNDCANESSSCTWNQVATGPNYLADTSGQYRLTINYTGGCFIQYYFNVYENLLSPTVISNDIICTTAGSIIINDVPSGYEYSLDGINFQTSNLFSVNTAGFYTVFIRQVGVSSNPCIFTVPNIQIRDRNFSGSTTITQPFCFGDRGDIIIAANNAEPQYTFNLFQGGILINSSGLLTTNNYAFNNLNAGNYTVTAETEDGCFYTEDITIIEPPLLTVTAALTAPITCSDGEITIYPVGGTPPYSYFINSTTDFQTVPEFGVSTAGTYDITVVDSNNCSATTSIDVSNNPAPQYTITQTDILCYNDASGVIEFNIINANGYDIEFSIDNGVSFSSNILYTNLLAGDYDVIIRYTLDNAVCETAVQTITITQPDEALTATAGISQLAGCGPNGEGTIRITNPQGGTPFPAPNFYEYSFDNQNTWTTLNEALVNPGTYTVYIRDANGCVFAMDDVVLGQEPPAPTINISDADFNCDGTANATVTVTNSGASDYSYEYFIDGVLNPNTADPQTFLNVPAGPHTISVEYTLQTVPTFSNLLYETFGYGSDTTSPGINTAFYCFERQVAATQCRNSPRINDGDYSVTSNIVFPFGAWINPTDYTPTTVPPTPNGRFLVVNIGAAIPVTEILYEKEINDIIPNQPIQVEFAAMNLLRPGNTQFDPDLRVALVDASGTEISFYNTGNIPKTGNWIEYPTTPITLNPGNNTTLKFILRSNVQQTSGNDVAIDDIRVFQLPQACTTTVDFPIIIDPGNAFSAQVTSTSMVSCDGNADGTITIGVQNFDPVNGFEYSIDNGVTWVNQMTAPFSIGGLTSGTYSIDVRFDNAPNTCLFTFSETIASADPITISYTNTDVTCLDGATITASAIGGTPNYTFQLIDTLAPFTVTNFGSNGILTNVSPGSYTLNVTDAQGCTASIPLVLDPPETPTATISTASDLCYDTSNGASIEVSAAGGVPPYQYSINGGAFQASNIFNNLTPGSYTIAVRDDFGCEVVLPAQIIQPQLITATTLIKNLDCTLSPDAIITGTISGGYTPYTYEVSINGGPFTSLGSNGTSFTYATSVSGDFQFQITDAQGCIALSQVQTIEPLVLPEIISVTESQSILCNGDSNGAIDIVINNTLGAAPFSINVNNNTTATNYGNQTSGLPAGNYTITLTDNNGCTDTATITLAEPDTIVVTSSAIPITCIPGGGVSQGSVIVDSVVGGTAPYTYNVTGSNGYSNSEFNNTGSTSVSFNVINFGLYEINVIDANGCSVLVQNVLVASPPDDLDITINTTADCASGGEATVSVNTLLAGSGPFFFTIYDGTIPPPPPGGTWQAETSPGETIFTGLTPGVLYTFLVFDQLTGCYYFETADTPIQSNATLTANALSINNISCTGNADGNVSFTVNNPEIVDIDFNYEIFDALSLISTSVTGSDTAPASGSITISDFGALDFGTYYVLITETSGPNANCSIATAPFSITESIVPLTLSTSVDNNANCNPNTGVISAVAQNGTAPYFYQITTNAAAPLASDPNWTSDSVFNVNGGSYYIHALDTFGCIVSSLELVVNTDPAPEVTAVVTNQCTINEGNYEIEVDLLVNGIAPHSFSIDGGAFQQQTVPFTISNLASGTHTIEVRDVNGCGNSVSVVIEPPLDVTANTTQNPSCSDVDGEITVNGFGGSGNYSYSISPAPPSINLSGNIFSGVPSGTYIITVTDTTTSCTDTVTATLEVATPVNFTLDAIDVICNGENTGAIIVNLPPSNDNPIYTYEILSPIVVAPQTSNVFTGLSAGVYTIQVTSGKNCTATQTIAVSEPNVINILAPTVSQYTCDPSDNSLNFASITVDTVSGGSGNYVIYEFIKNGTVVQFSSNNTYIESDLTGGTYTINVYDDNGCTGTVATSIDIAPFIDFDTTTVNIDNAITCTNLEDITVNVITTGGVTPNLEFIVQDVVGNVNGGNYNQTNNTGIFTGLDVGNYIITVNNLDTGCSTQDVHFVDDPDTFDILINTVESVTCFNDNTGSVNVTFIDLVVSGTNPDQSGAFNYTISDDLGNIVVTGTTTDAGPIDITGLFAGNYTISATLINNPFCTQAKNFTIARPSAPLALFVLETANVTCTNSEGTITASASGGWGNYEFELSGDANVAYSANGTFSNLAAGNYTVSVRDGLGCIVSENIILVEPDPITAIFTPNASILNCFGDQNGSISITNVIGGQGSNYTYTLNTILPTVSSSGPQTSNMFNNLSAGTYTVTIADDFGCELTSTNIVISNPTLVSASLVRATAQTCLTESTLTLSATGGTAPYTYSDDSSFSSVLGNFSTSVTFSVPAGTYFYYVRDANNCVSAVSNDITIDPVPTLTIELESDSPTINCAGDTNGNILATATGGLGNYVYTLQDVAGNTISATQNMPGFFTELPAGDYVVLVESGDCVTTSGTISITEPSTSLQATVSVTNVTCAGTNNGIIEVNANGGTGIIKYAISPQLNQFFDTNIFENLSPGIYEIIVQDELGCFLTFSVPVTEPTQVILNIVPGSILPELCAGDNNGEFSVAISGGTMPYSVSLDNYDGPYTTGSSGQTLFDFIDLQGGDHIVFVRDSEGCESEWNITFPESVTINPIVDVLYDCEQDTLNNTITVSVDASITDMTDLDFSINNGPYQASNVFINVAAGLDNFINVRHTNGCIQTTELFDIIDYEPLVLEIVESGLNEITANATGGNGDYTFTFNDENLGSENIYNFEQSGLYTVTVTDSNGCIATARIELVFIEICIPNYFSPNGDGITDTWAPGCIDNYPNLDFDIFDRYGRKVATYRAGQFWDGRYNGTELPTGDYWYVVRTNDTTVDREFVGHFTLYR